MRSFLSRICVAGALAYGICTSASARDWESAADLVSAGAAASIVGTFRCHGEASANAARDEVSVGIQAWLRDSGLAHSAEAKQYIENATNIKVKAMWQANANRPCAQLQNLRDIVRGVGFRVLF